LALKPRYRKPGWSIPSRSAPCGTGVPGAARLECQAYLISYLLSRCDRDLIDTPKQYSQANYVEQTPARTGLDPRSTTWFATIVGAHQGVGRFRLPRSEPEAANCDLEDRHPSRNVTQPMFQVSEQRGEVCPSPNYGFANGPLPFPPIKISHTLIRMRRSLCALAFVLSLSGAVSGCAAYNTYEKCGFRGCPGDAKITSDVLAKFSQRLDLEPNAISVQTLDHVVYLYGLVSSSLEISTAESIARKVPGVTGVVNSVAAETR